MLIRCDGIYKDMMFNDDRKVYDVVRISEVFIEDSSSLEKSIVNEFVFVFATILNESEEHNNFGHVSIKLVHYAKVSPLCNRQSQKRMYYHNFGSKIENLNINDFLELIIEKNEDGLIIYALLKNQNVLDEDGAAVGLKKDYCVVLLKENYKFSNEVNLFIPKEFELVIRYEEAMSKFNTFCGAMEYWKGCKEQGFIKEKRASLHKNAISILSELESYKSSLDYINKK